MQDRSSNWKRLFSAERVAPVEPVRSQWIETLAIPVAALALAWFVSPRDPLLIQSAFPWLWFAPVLVALRYGVLAGLVSGMLILFDWMAGRFVGTVTADFPHEYFFGGGMLVLLVGEFSDVWRDRNLRMEESRLYVTERLSRLTRRHLLLNLSHDRLEQEMLARPGSLRDALARLRDVVIEGGGDTRLPAGDGLLQLLAQYVNIESATLYTVVGDHGHYRLGEVATEIGEPCPLEADDELLTQALEKGTLAHIANQEVLLDRRSNQLIVAPLVASDDTVIGVLAVTKLPFFSLNVENLQMMAVVLAYYADNVRAAPELERLRKSLPSMPAMFAEELSRMIHLQRKTRVDSQIIVLVLKGPHRDDIPEQLLRVKRGLDLYWQTVVAGHPAVAVLLPFASSAAKEGFLERIEGWLKNRFDGDFETLRVDLHAMNMSGGDVVENLARLMRQ